MKKRDVINSIKKTWDWLWNSESILSYIAFLIVIFVVMKFLFLPVLGIAMGSELPIAIVESSSMDHGFTKDCLSANEKGICQKWTNDYSICGNRQDQRVNLDLDTYWTTCGDWYKDQDITKEQFKDFSLKNGFKKGDILILIGWKEPKIGDVLLFKPNQGSTARHPIIHRIISTDPIQTKGDHNEGQLHAGNNPYRTDETSISEEQVIGVAVAKIPYLGWIKLFFMELWNKIR